MVFEQKLYLDNRKRQDAYDNLLAYIVKNETGHHEVKEW